MRHAPLSLLSKILFLCCGAILLWDGEVLAQQPQATPVPPAVIQAVKVVETAWKEEKFQEAFAGYQQNKEVFRAVLPELEPAFAVWVLGRLVESGQAEEADALARSMIVLFDARKDRIPATERGRLQALYAEISLQRQEYARARAQFEAIASNPDFQETPSRLEAQFRIAEIDRLTKQFSNAFAILERLARDPAAAIRARAFLELAYLNFDQEDYDAAAKNLEQVFALQPENAPARILQGQINLRTRRLIEATEVRVGLAADQQLIVPGTPLRITLEDQNLATVGTANLIEVRIWTDSGDEEFLSLLPFGDTTTRFEAELATGMGAPQKGDRVLQVLGGDIVNYDFSPAFKESNSIQSSQVVSLTVASDAELAASSGEILSSEERARRRFESELRERLIRSGQIDEEEDTVTLAESRPEDQIKPGNFINVRVVDPARNLNPERDTVTVGVTTSSGAQIPDLELTETGPFTGVFEGKIPTRTALPTASSTSFVSGETPEQTFGPENVLLASSPRAWVASPNPNIKPRLLNIDLKDNVALGEMKILADARVGDQLRRLRSFLVQTSFNGLTYETVGSFPKETMLWKGNPELSIGPVNPDVLAVLRSPSTKAPAVLNYLESGIFSSALRRLSMPVSSADVRLEGAQLEQVNNYLRFAENQSSVMRFRTALWTSRRETRVFRIVPQGMPEHTQVLIAIDGEFAARSSSNPGEIRVTLDPGLHRLDAILLTDARVAPDFEVQVSDPMSSDFVPLPKSMIFAPEIGAAFSAEPAQIRTNETGTEFFVKFPPDTNARFVRLVIFDFEGEAPAVNKVFLTNTEGGEVLPLREEATSTEGLAISAGDRVTLRYTNPAPITEGLGVQEALLSATFSDATINSVAVLPGREDRPVHEQFREIRRFRVGDRINVLISDPDRDVSGEKDTVEFSARTSGGQTTTVRALETSEHSGLFLGAIFTTKGEPTREGELPLKEGENIVLSYLDRENMNPGIPWVRSAVVEQVLFSEPEIRIFEMESIPLSESEALTHVKSAPRRVSGLLAGEQAIVPTKKLVGTRPAEPCTPDQTTPALLGAPILVEVQFPYSVLSPTNEASLYVQTSSGRAMAGAEQEEESGAFDPTVPGTIKLTARPSDFKDIHPGTGYARLDLRGLGRLGFPVEDGRFSFQIPVQLAPVPENSLVDLPAMEKPRLSVRGNDVIFVGFPYKDPEGVEHWMTASLALDADAFLNVMDRRYREDVSGIHVGETLYFRVGDPSKDVTDQKDTVLVAVSTAGGTTREVELMETTGTSGVFQGLLRLVHPSDTGAETTDFSVDYGQRLQIAYLQDGAREPVVRDVEVFKGSDGIVMPFTKTYQDPDMAVQTQFTIAEAHFEMAKKHREMGEEVLAQRGMAQGRRVLEEAMRDFPDSEFQSQAEYLLANLALEMGDLAKEETLKRQNYLEAITKFTEVVAQYPESPYAPKAQYKKALTFEKMGEIDQASEEYVRLSYRFPDNELVAETIARLGQYFLTKGREMQDDLERLADPVEREAKRLVVLQTFRTAAEVFGRLAERFPNHNLATRASVLSGQCYMRAEDLNKAIEAFAKVADNPEAENEVRAEAMYWMADSHAQKQEYEDAYRIYKRLTWDYPASNWARFARGRLTEGPLATIAAEDI